MCKEHENRMVLPYHDDEPIPEPEEMDPDEYRELYLDEIVADRSAKAVTEEVMRDLDKIIDVIRKDYEPK